MDLTEFSPLVIIAGPTASGKSALAMEIASAFSGEIVNADSMQVYNELRILSARPGEADERAIPHHLYGFQPASESCSAGRWLAAAREVTDAIRARGNLPVFCGGTGLYLKVLAEGIAPVPAVPETLTAEARRDYDELGGEAFRDRLADVDPEAAGRLAAADRQRLTRTWSVATATGRTLADWQADQTPGPGIEGDRLTLALMPERDALYRRIEERFDAMMAAGGLEEARRLLDIHLDPSLPAMKAVGVPELLRHLKGECEREGAIETAKRMTRNFAKRQMTWFRRQIAIDLVLEDFCTPDTAAAGLEAVAAFLEAGKSHPSNTK